MHFHLGFMPADLERKTNLCFFKSHAQQKYLLVHLLKQTCYTMWSPSCKQKCVVEKSVRCLILPYSNEGSVSLLKPLGAEGNTFQDNRCIRVHYQNQLSGL